MFSENLIEAAQDAAESYVAEDLAPFVPRQKFRVFSLPKKLMFDDHLKTLGHDALKLYVLLAYKDYRKPADTQVSLAEWEVEKHLGIPQKNVPRARQELKDVGLIDFKRRSQYNVSYLVAKDISLHESVNSFDDLNAVKIT
jgi:hypothetical protein